MPNRSPVRDRAGPADLGTPGVHRGRVQHRSIEPRQYMIVPDARLEASVAPWLVIRRRRRSRVARSMHETRVAAAETRSPDQRPPARCRRAAGSTPSRCMARPALDDARLEQPDRVTLLDRQLVPLRSATGNRDHGPRGGIDLDGIGRLILDLQTLQPHGKQARLAVSTGPSKFPCIAGATMLRISSNAGAGSNLSPHGSVRLIESHRHLGRDLVGADRFRCLRFPLRRLATPRGTAPTSAVPGAGLVSDHQFAGGWREKSAKRRRPPRTYKMFWRPSMPPNSPTEKSLNGSDGVATGPMSEQPATVNVAAATSTATVGGASQRSPQHHDELASHQVPGRLTARPFYFLINDRSTYCMIPPLR